MRLPGLLFKRVPLLWERLHRAAGAASAVPSTVAEQQNIPKLNPAIEKPSSPLPRQLRHLGARDGLPMRPNVLRRFSSPAWWPVKAGMKRSYRRLSGHKGPNGCQLGCGGSPLGLGLGKGAV